MGTVDTVWSLSRTEGASPAPRAQQRPVASAACGPGSFPDSSRTAWSARPMPTDQPIAALTARYAIRKAETPLLPGVMSDGVVVHVARRDVTIGLGTRVVGPPAHVPIGLRPVGTRSMMVSGGGPNWSETYFVRLGGTLAPLRARHRSIAVTGVLPPGAEA